MKKLNLELLAKLSNSFASFHYDADVEIVQKARVPSLTPADKKNGLTETDLQRRITAFNLNMKKAGVTPLEKGAKSPYAVVHKTSDYVVSIGAKLHYVKKTEAIIKRGGVDAEYKPSHENRGMFPVYGELIYVSNDLQTMYFTVYRASVPKTIWSADGKPVKKENIAQIIKDKKVFDKLCGIDTDYLVRDKDGNLIYQQNEDGTLKTDEQGNPMTMAVAPIQRVKMENAIVKIKGKILQFTTNEDWDESELAAIRDEYYKRMEALTAQEA
jgi:hypothetical protein